MLDVCGRGDNQKGCNEFASGIEGIMTDDNNVNRNELDLAKFCTGYWEGAVSNDAKNKVQKLNEEDAARAQEEAESQEKADLEEAEKLGKQAAEDDKVATENQKALEANIQAVE